MLTFAVAGARVFSFYEGIIIVKKIIVLFKTHLDVGFTNFAGEVVRRYNEEFIPRAIAVGEEIAAMGREEGFVWTTGSWLIHQYLQQADKEQYDRACRAIDQGLICWHGLPATLHSEYANADLFRYGLSLSQQLDAQFGTTTIGAKYTDVPGHTRAIVPLMHQAGLRFLHVGVNPACVYPDVPDMFRWRAPGGEEIVVMYNKGDYGEFTVIPHTDTAIYFAHTGDNLGPQSARLILDIYDELYQKYPGVTIRAGTLNDAALAVLPIADTLPVVTAEIGDSWIHGTGSAPQKTNQFRALLRLAKDWDEDTKRQLYSHLLMVPEHTWGLDEKTHLHDHFHYSKPEFNAMRTSVDHPEYRKMEDSWQEQRDYITAGVEALSGAPHAAAREALAECRVDYPDLSAFAKCDTHCVTKNGWTIAFDEHGAIVQLQKDGKTYADVQHRLCDFRYEVFSEKEVLAFGDRYIKKVFDWILEDIGKVGLSAYMDEYQAFSIDCDGIYTNDCDILLTLSADPQATAVYGCPPRFTLRITPRETGLDFDFAWYDKPALRIPEGLWLGFCPTRPLTGIRKLDSVIDPLDVVSGGNREMHCSDDGLLFDGWVLQSLDTPLFAIEKPAMYAFYDRLPDTQKGVWLNLFNNQFGTNFPMWNEGDARFRFSFVPG